MEPVHVIILGLSLGEWMSIIGIIAFISGLVSVLFKYIVFGPIQNDLKDLSDNIGGLKKSLDELKNQYDKLDRRVDEHDRRLDRHHEQIKTLFHEKGDPHEI